VSLPARVIVEVQRLLDAEARRLLADQLDRDAIGTTAGSDPDLIDGRADQGAAGVEGQSVPIRVGVQDQRLGRAA
jgi:hypothetical protein